MKLTTTTSALYVEVHGEEGVNEDVQQQDTH